ncbi:peptidyl-prolyl cis-trans isomerase Mip [Thiomicrorhabdus immobilis]|uniref:Peptidyl-prolyl cis-trans isomerase n=1 Tax=Thiomicrorhabdus immobilis TaxID=2791037 RepID=A0ABM7MCI0_9GAMM|nr:FKBP-type peptidyl-prolyl cis-trans isomerase [Thiomicrorhabdus immobilis]BCN93023.1 peptidyl-prolyl cis-trans isomerase Mip [Thiomicrorhabdus immobilis]
MKKILFLSLGLLTTQNVIAADPLTTTEQKASYTLGSDLAKNFAQQGLKIDIQAFTLGFEDAMNNRKSRLSEEEMMKAITEVKKEMMQKQIAHRKAQGEANLKEGEAYMADNAKKAGVKTLDSGIQYKVIKSGKGNSPTENDTIFAHYEGSFIDGKVFDSSYKRGTPLKFQMGNVIKGWGEVLKHMKPGDKWEVVIPSNLAYGEKGAGETIGPNKTLLFTIELIQFDKAE